VTEAVSFPDQVVEGYGGRLVAHKKHVIDDKDYLLRVVYEVKDNSCVVFTAYLTSQVSRYWKEI
jgi:hypothetical protein